MKPNILITRVLIVVPLLLIHEFASAEDKSVQPDINKLELMNLINDNNRPSFSTKEWGPRNPFDVSGLQEPSETEEQKVIPSSEGLALQGIFLGSDRPSAIINGTIVGIGDTINGAVVKEIKEGEVVLDSKGSLVSLSLKQVK